MDINFDKEILIMDSLSQMKRDFSYWMKKLYRLDIKNKYDDHNRNTMYKDENSKNIQKLLMKIDDTFIHYIFNCISESKTNEILEIDKFKIPYEDIQHYHETYNVILPSEDDIKSLERDLIEDFKDRSTIRNIKYTFEKVYRDGIEISYIIKPRIPGLKMIYLPIQRYITLNKSYMNFNNVINVINNTQDIITSNGNLIYFDKLVCLMLLRYSILGTENQHLSVPPFLMRNFLVNVELFGTPINTSSKIFCSPFNDVEKYFGSQGSFFKYNFESNKIYAFNPPYVEEIMNRGAKYMIEKLEKLENFIVFCHMPVWDSKSQRENNFEDFGMNFEAFETLTSSKFYRSKAILERKDFPYYSYFSNSYIPASNTHCIILSDKKENDPYLPKAEDVKSAWKELVSTIKPKYR